LKVIKLEELIERLTLGGFEVEEILEVEVNNKKQTVLDISATANRSDSLSIQGISSEIASLLNKQLLNYLILKKLKIGNKNYIIKKNQLFTFRLFNIFSN
jgi:phenylalanyl-tRNA synthetase beta subunit